MKYLCMFLNGPACHSFEVDQIPVYVFEWTIHLHLSYQMPFVPLSENDSFAHSSCWHNHVCVQSEYTIFWEFDI